MQSLDSCRFDADGMPGIIVMFFGPALAGFTLRILWYTKGFNNGIVPMSRSSNQGKIILIVLDCWFEVFWLICGLLLPD